MLEWREVPEQGVDGQQQGAQGEQMFKEQGHGETPFKCLRQTDRRSFGEGDFSAVNED
jgi:hypothetical protein